MLYASLLLSAGAPAARHPQLSTGICYRRQQQTRRPPLLQSIDMMDGQTDRQTLSPYSHTYRHTYYYWYSITHSLFHSRLKSLLFCKSSLPQPFLFYRAMLCIRGTSHGPVSVCLSVRPSVTSRCSTKTAKRRITHTTPHDSSGTLVS